MIEPRAILPFDLAGVLNVQEPRPPATFPFAGTDAAPTRTHTSPTPTSHRHPSRPASPQQRPRPASPPSASPDSSQPSRPSTSPDHRSPDCPSTTSTPDPQHRPSRHHRRPARSSTARNERVDVLAAIRGVVLAEELVGRVEVRREHGVPEPARVAEVRAVDGEGDDVPRPDHRRVGALVRRSRSRSTSRSRIHRYRRAGCTPRRPRLWRGSNRCRGRRRSEASMIGATVVILSVISPVASFPVTTWVMSGERPLGVTGRIRVRRIGDPGACRHEAGSCGDDSGDDDPQLQASTHCETPLQCRRQCRSAAPE